MISVERTLQVSPSPERVFAYLRDFDNAEQWDAGTVSCSRIDDGPIAAGSRWKNVSTFLGRQTELVYTLRTDEPDSHLVFDGENKTVTSEDDMTLRPMGGGTEVTYRARFSFKGASRFLEPLLKLALGKLANDTEKTLRTALSAISS